MPCALQRQRYLLRCSTVVTVLCLVHLHPCSKHICRSESCPEAGNSSQRFSRHVALLYTRSERRRCTSTLHLRPSLYIGILAALEWSARRTLPHAFLELEQVPCSGQRSFRLLARSHSAFVALSTHVFGAQKGSCRPYPSACRRRHNPFTMHVFTGNFAVCYCQFFEILACFWNAFL